jgi:hypothetical protein
MLEMAKTNAVPESWDVVPISKQLETKKIA